MSTKQTAIKNMDQYIAGFPLEKPIPYTLIGKIVKLRVKDNLERAEAEGKKK